MSPLSESQLVRRVFELRESTADTEDFAREISSRLSVSSEEAHTIATVLEDRFVSPEEQLQLLGNVELRGALLEGSTASGFLRALAGGDGREALRHRAGHLVDSLRSDPRGAESNESVDAAIDELTQILPHGLGLVGGSVGLGSPLAVGMLHYLRPEDSFLRGLVDELRGYRMETGDPVLRMRSARVLAGLGDRDARHFLRESTASFEVDYRGALGWDERISRASGLAADGHSTASVFLLNVAMNPEETDARRYRALSYLRPDSLEFHPDATEVFRSLAEDPEEPVSTRYGILSLLTRSPHPPAPEWWQNLLRDSSMTCVLGREASGGSATPGGSSGVAFSQWNLVLTALSETSEPWAGEILLAAAGHRGLPLAQRREALMGYFLNRESGSLPWETVREVLGGAERPLGEMRLRFPHAGTRSSDPAAFDLRRLGFIEKEYVLDLRETGMGTRVLHFRPIVPATDELSPAVAMSRSETALPLNRRITLWPFMEEAPVIDLAEAEPEAVAPESLGGGAPSSLPPSPAAPSTGQQVASAPRSNHRQNNASESTVPDYNVTHGI